KRAGDRFPVERLPEAAAASNSADAKRIGRLRRVLRGWGAAKSTRRVSRGVDRWNARARCQRTPHRIWVIRKTGKTCGCRKEPLSKRRRTGGDDYVLFGPSRHAGVCLGGNRRSALRRKGKHLLAVCEADCACAMRCAAGLVSVIRAGLGG